MSNKEVTFLEDWIFPSQSEIFERAQIDWIKAGSSKRPLLLWMWKQDMHG